ncbi:hypothetical protein ZWY2020_000676 [Hordeum vulgare]|nr:hypothetical protein ZWY2020_000676 [Hordeum vulgare]
MGSPLSSWPWAGLGAYKYLLYGPLVAGVAQAWREQGGAPTDSWCLHLLLLLALRSLTHQLWFSYANMLFFTRRRRVVPDGVDFVQIDAEWDWDNMVIMQTLLGAMAISSPVFPAVSDLRVWEPRGWAVALLLHVAVSEPGFRWAHRALHRGPLFSRYHSKHHASPVTQPLTSAYGTPLESLVLTLAMAAPLAGAFLAGAGSDLPGLPLLRYLMYTPTYLSLHHQEKDSNFCLFMPLFDLLGGTVHPRSWELQKEVDQGKNDRVPDFVFLAHVVDVVSSMHVPFAFRACSSQPWATRLVLLPLWPIAFCLMVLQVLCSKTFTVSFYCLRGALHQTWTIPRYSFQYFIPPMKDGINRQIELAILRADKMGVKVLSLAALNKNEALNGGGTLFVDKHPDLRLGRAIALYLCRKRIRVLMLTLSSERFLKIQREAPAEFQQYLVQVTKYHAAKTVKTWLVGKWLSPREQRWAPAGTHFHQFVVPPVIEFRRDCTYGKLAAMRLPKDVQGLGSCEYTMERGVVHACHAGGVVHCLEGWEHHEVGAIDVDRIDVVWKAALRHGLSPP